MSESMEEAAGVIKRLRIESGYSLEEVAEKTGASLETLELFEKGKTKISIYLLEDLLYLYGYDIGIQKREVADRISPKFSP